MFWIAPLTQPTWRDIGLLRSIKRMMRPVQPVLQWVGGFDSWSSADHSSQSYHDDDLIERVVSSSLEVIKGDAVAERDGVVLDRVDTDTLLSAFFSSLKQEDLFHDAPLRVLDIGGALGTAYRQAKGIVGTSQPLQWTIVEQKPLAQVGMQQLASDELHFVSEITSSLLKETDLIYFGSSLCYIENAFQIIEMLGDSSAQTLIIERTPFSRDDGGSDHRHRVTRQIVDHNLMGYGASGIDSYPCYVFSHTALVHALSPDWQLESSQQDRVQPAFDPVHQSLLFTRVSDG
ncbi:MAG: methyltransferase, TIGR04325 family [Coriobacteriia bacterium]|nr:methyltransferase, TIGR04325 family [Coriobacteriia bacterium]